MPVPACEGVTNAKSSLGEVDTAKKNKKQKYIPHLCNMAHGWPRR
jgi:hypothetical protein